MDHLNEIIKFVTAQDESSNFTYVGCNSEEPEKIYFNFVHFLKNEARHSYVSIFDGDGDLVTVFKDSDGRWMLAE